MLWEAYQKENTIYGMSEKQQALQTIQLQNNIKKVKRIFEYIFLIKTEDAALIYAWK